MSFILKDVSSFNIIFHFKYRKYLSGSNSENQINTCLNPIDFNWDLGIFLNISVCLNAVLNRDGQLHGGLKQVQPSKREEALYRTTPYMYRYIHTNTKKPKKKVGI